MHFLFCLLSPIDDWNMRVGWVGGKGTVRRDRNILYVNSRSDFAHSVQDENCSSCILYTYVYNNDFSNSSKVADVIFQVQYDLLLLEPSECYI